MTARWVVDIAPQRDLSIRWLPISLLFKNDPDPGSDRYDFYARTHGLLRVMESVRVAEGETAVGELYTEYGRRIMHDQQFHFDLGEALEAIGLDPSHGAAADDGDRWDDAIREGMDAGLALVGDDVGTPIIGFSDGRGAQVGIFGPVIAEIPEGEAALELWDHLVALATMPGFYELKRTRQERPSFGPRP